MTYPGERRKITRDLAKYLSGSTEPWTVSVLQALLRTYAPYHTLELGTFEGRTTRALAEVLPSYGWMTTVELDEKRSETAQAYCRGVPAITFKVSEAIDFLRNAQKMNASYDFVFIDDSHEKGHVEEEVDLLLDGIVPSGGLIVGHDVIGPFDLADVFESRGGFIIELPLLHSAGGLGVIQV